jgi:heme A synthase
MMSSAIRPSALAACAAAGTLGLMVVGSAVEQSHPVLSIVLVAVTLAFAVSVVRLAPRHRWIVLAAGTLLSVQATLGLAMVTLGTRPPTAVPVAHFALAMGFLSLTVFTSVWLARRRNEAPPLHAPLQTGLAVAVLVVFAQIVLGGIVRHSGATLLCPDLIGCGEVPVGPSLHRVHMLHRAMGIASAIAALTVSVTAFRRARGDHRLRMLALLPGAFVLIEIGLGLFVIASRATAASTVLHQLFGALLLASLVLLSALAESPADAVREPHRAAD